MMLGGTEMEWVARLGPVTRRNQAQSREQAEGGARQKVLDAVQEIEGAQCSGSNEPETKEDLPEVQVYSYQLDKGDWFSIALSGFFGVKLMCKR